MATNDGYFRLGKNGIAYRIVGYPKVWEACTYLATDDDGNEYEAESDCDGEWIDDETSGRVVVVMVGDDHKTTVDRSDLTPIDREAFCGSCGQIGCAHDGYDRDSD